MKKKNLTFLFIVMIIPIIGISQSVDEMGQLLATEVSQNVQGHIVQTYDDNGEATIVTIKASKYLEDDLIRQMVSLIPREYSDVVVLDGWRKVSDGYDLVIEMSNEIYLINAEGRYLFIVWENNNYE